MAQVTRKNLKAFETINLKLKELDSIEGQVGWFPSSKYENGTPIAYVAAVQELGSTNAKFPIPPRPFIRPTVISQRDNWAKVGAYVAKQALTGKVSGMEMMEAITSRAQGDVAKTINTLTAPALSPVTVELRVMRARDPGLKVTRSTVFEAIRRVKQPGYVTPTVNDKPLEDTGNMLASLDSLVQKVR